MQYHGHMRNNRRSAVCTFVICILLPGVAFLQSAPTPTVTIQGTYSCNTKGLLVQCQCVDDRGPAGPWNTFVKAQSILEAQFLASIQSGKECTEVLPESFFHRFSCDQVCYQGSDRIIFIQESVGVPSHVGNPCRWYGSDHPTTTIMSSAVDVSPDVAAQARSANGDFICSGKCPIQSTIAGKVSVHCDVGREAEYDLEILQQSAPSLTEATTTHTPDAALPNPNSVDAQQNEAQNSIIPGS